MKQAREIFLKNVALVAKTREEFLEKGQDLVLRAAINTANSFAQGGKLLLCGNGGGSVIAQYLAGCFTGVFYMERPPLPALALSREVFCLGDICGATDSSSMEARPLQALARPGDVLLVISDNSASIGNALVIGREIGLFTIGIGEMDGDLSSLCDISLAAPALPQAQRVELYLAFANLYGRLVDYFLFENPAATFDVSDNDLFSK